VQFIIISGLSGAGKSRAASIMEDMGVYCVDNLPGAFIPMFAEHCLASGKYDRVALVVDIRGRSHFDTLFADLKTIEAQGVDCHIFFVEAKEEVLVKRYKESRRPHPLMKDSESLLDALATERKILAPMREQAMHVLDTSYLTAAKLKDELRRIYGGEESSPQMSVRVASFGFKHSLPLDADLVLDVRFLPNPFYTPELRYLTGMDDAVVDYLHGFEETKEFLQKLTDMLTFLLPRYMAEGKTNLVIAIGCTGGKHRSVAITRALCRFIDAQGYAVTESHLDILRER